MADCCVVSQSVCRKNQRRKTIKGKKTQVIAYAELVMTTHVLPLAATQAWAIILVKKRMPTPKIIAVDILIPIQKSLSGFPSRSAKELDHSNHAVRLDDCKDQMPITTNIHE